MGDAYDGPDYNDNATSVPSDGDNYFSQFENAPAATTPASNDNYFAQFEQPPQQKPPDNYFAQFEQQPQLPKAESPFWSGVRKFAHGIGPTLAGAAAGAATMGGYGALAGSVAALPGPGTVGGLLIGGAAGLVTGGVSGYLASEAQEAAAKALNFDDSLQQAANEEANPGSTLIGGALTAAVPFGMGRGVVTLGQRVFSGALMGGVETGSQYAEGKPFDPAAIALNVGMGAAFPQPRKFLNPVEAAGGRLGARAAEMWHGTPGSDAAAGTAQEQPSPKAGTTVEPGAAAATPEATAPAGDRGGPEDYGKDTPPAAERQGVNVGETDPAVDAAIRAKMQPESATTVEVNGQPRPDMAAQATQAGEAARAAAPEDRDMKAAAAWHDMGLDQTDRELLRARLEARLNKNGKLTYDDLDRDLTNKLDTTTLAGLKQSLAENPRRALDALHPIEQSAPATASAQPPPEQEPAAPAAPSVAAEQQASEPSAAPKPTAAPSGGIGNIIEQTGPYSIRRSGKGFEVYEDGPTASTRVARIGYSGDKGLERARQEVARRMPAPAATLAERVNKAQAARPTEELTRNFAEELLRRPSVLNIEAAKRGIPPEQLKSVAAEIVKAEEGAFVPKPLEPTATAKLSDTDLQAAHQQASEQFRKTVEQSADMTSPEIVAAKSRVQELGNELAARRGPQQQSGLDPVPVVAPLKPTRQPSDYTGKLDPNISASDYVQRMTEMQVNKPRPINKLWRNADTAPPGAVADQIRKIKDWNNEYAKVSKNQKLALERDNAAYRAQQEGKAHSLSAAAAPPTAPINSAPPASPIGKTFAGIKQAVDGLFDIGRSIGRDLQMKVAPMATGTKESILPAKDFIIKLRQIDHDWAMADDAIMKKFTPEQQERIWNAMDEESVMRQRGETSEHMGIATLEPEERALADSFQPEAKAIWARLTELGSVKGEGLPYWTPRMLANGLERGEAPRTLDRIGGNLKTTTGSLKARKYETAEETETAMKKHFGEQAGIARNVRVMPLALAKLKKVIAGREFVDKIREIGKATGADTVAAGSKPGPGWFHIDHPALYDMRIRPRMEEADTRAYREAVEGHGVIKVPPAEIPLFDRNGKPVLNYDRVPLWIRGNFEGPARAVLTQPSGPAYQQLMSLKGKTMGLLMNSPMIHLAVEIGRALPSMPGKILSGRIFADGNRANLDSVTTREAIGGGQDPIGKRYFDQDVTSLMEQPNLTPGRSWTSQVLSFVPGLFDEKAGLAVKRAIDKAGDFWHNTLLWDRIRALQMGLYVNYRDNLVAKGVSREEAVILAAHWSNRFAGSLPQEAMSDSARKVANLLLFSRTFTLGNLGVMKDMFTGAPKDTLAMLERAGGSQKALDAAKSMARRKAISIVALDMGLMYIGNSLLQSASNVMRGDKTLDQEGQGYADRLSVALKNVRENPLSILQPMSLAQSLSATSENEPGKQDRILVGHTKDGTGIYARNPVGKIGEEFAGYLSGPLDMLRRKLGTLVRPTWQVLANDKGFGRKVYDPNADSIGDYVKNAGAIATHFATAQLPDIQLSGAYNALTGQGDTTLATTQALGPLAGVTFSKGAPDGPAVGELYKEAERQRFAVNEALPEIRQMITNNDIPGAMKRMIDLKMPAWQRNITIRQALNPSARLTPTAVRKFNQTATPAERNRFERMRQ